MPAKAAQPKKKEKEAAASSSGGGKAKKKKWSKGKVRDKLNNMVRFIFNPFVLLSSICLGLIR
jgi:small subunit ribosomal protein S25e